MNTIVVPVSDKRPEDNILDLVNLFHQEFGDEIIRVSSALVIETDNPHIAAIFKSIAESSGIIIANNKGSPTCIDCGEPVSKPGKRCKSCANKFYRKAGKKAALADLANAREFVTETNEGGNNNGIGE